jgi:hypothetical protein
MSCLGLGGGRTQVWGSIGCSFRLSDVCLDKKGTGDEDLGPALEMLLHSERKNEELEICIDSYAAGSRNLERFVNIDQCHFVLDM